MVGTKTPRYSIFGEAVKMASRMSRNGEGTPTIYLFYSKRIDVNVFKDTSILSVSFIVVMKIQISDDMKNALLQYGNKYLITERGEIEVYVSIMFT